MPFLHRLDSLEGEAELVETSHARLREAVFLDGRETFWTRRMLLATNELELVTEAEPLSFLFHTGFCGSTLLARLLDRRGERFVLREPQAIADMASQYHLLAAQASRRKADRVLSGVIGALAGSAPGGETAIVKPSCWVNPLLPHLVRDGHVQRATFLSQEPRNYLAACFRGGHDRLAYCAHFAQMLADTDPAMGEELQMAITTDTEPLDRMARIVVLLHAQQTALFTEAAETLGNSRVMQCDFADISLDFIDAAKRLATFLAPSSKAEISETAGTILNSHAKDPSRSFTADEQDRQDLEIEQHHASRFDAALEWLAKALPHRISAGATP